MLGSNAAVLVEDAHGVVDGVLAIERRAAARTKRDIRLRTLGQSDGTSVAS